MTADYTRRIKISRQRLTTNDENAAKAYQGKMTIDLARALCGDEVDKSGILRGCRVFTAGGLTVRVTAGLGLFYDAASGAPDSVYRLIEVPDAGILANIDAGGVQPRWDLIEIQPNSIDGSPETLDFWDPVTGAFLTSSAAPLKISSPTVQIFKGTEAASPTLPSGTAGWMPLAYQYVPAAAAALSNDDILYCRPILRPGGDKIFDPEVTLFGLPVSRFDVSGGGVDIFADGAIGSVWNTMEGYFPQSATPFRIPGGTGISVEFGCYDGGGGLPLADERIYFYAVPPPLPDPGGIVLAPRELYILNAGRIGGGYNGQNGCLVVSSTASPAGVSSIGNPSGIATFDPHPTFGPWPAKSTARVRWYYIGSAYWDHPVGLCQQAVSGDRVAPARKPGIYLTTFMPYLVATNVNITITYPGDPPMEYPAHCFDVIMRIGSNFPLNPGGVTMVSFWDETRDPSLTGGEDASVARLSDDWSLLFHNSSQEFLVKPFEGRYIKVDYADSTSAAPTAIRCESYRDGILALR